MAATAMMLRVKMIGFMPADYSVKSTKDAIDVRVSPVGGPMKSFFRTIFFFLCSNSPAVDPSATIKLEPFVKGGLSAPVYILPDPRKAGRYFVLEQRGVISTVTNGQVDATPFLDISNKVEYGGEMGLLGLALHKNFATNGRYLMIMHLDGKAW